MLRACRHDHQVSGFHVLVFAVDGRFSGSGGESQGLVDGVDLENVCQKVV